MRDEDLPSTTESSGRAVVLIRVTGSAGGHSLTPAADPACPRLPGDSDRAGVRRSDVAFGLVTSQLVSIGVKGCAGPGPSTPGPAADPALPAFPDSDRAEAGSSTKSVRTEVESPAKPCGKMSRFNWAGSRVRAVIIPS
jgi:hypothetical protein